MKNSSYLNLKNLSKNNLDTNVNLFWLRRSKQRKRAFKKYLFQINESCTLIQDQEYEQRIKSLYSLFVFIDIYVLQTSVDLKELERFPVYIYLIYRCLRKLNILNSSSKDKTFASKKKSSEQELLKLTMIHNHISLQKIEQLKEIDRLLVLSEEVLINIKEKLNEKHVD
jgi:hypothetical protein